VFTWCVEPGTVPRQCRIVVCVCVSAESSTLSVGVIVGVVLAGGALVLLLLVLSVVVIRRRRRRKHRCTSRARRLPTFADMTVSSEIRSFLPADDGLRGGTGEVRDQRAVSVESPPSYDSVVKSCNVDDPVVCRRVPAARRSHARLSLPPITAVTVPPPVCRTHRRAESDTEEHVYEDPTSLRRSVSRDGLGCALPTDPVGVNRPAASQEDDVAGRPAVCGGPSEPLLTDAVDPRNAVSELVRPQPCYSVPSNTSLSTPTSLGQPPPRVPRVRLGTSALYCRTAELPASANQLRPFSPLSAMAYAQATDSFSQPCRTAQDDFAIGDNGQCVRYISSADEQQRVAPVNYWSQDAQSERCGQCIQPRSHHHHHHHDGRGAGYYCSVDDDDDDDDDDYDDDEVGSTTSARSGSSVEDAQQLHDLSQVSPLLDDDNTASVDAV